MARTLKTNGIYNITCVLTGEPAGTTPAVFEARAKRYGVSIDQLKQSYIGRTGANQLKKLVTEQDVEPSAAIATIRQAFGVDNSSPVNEQVIDKIVGQVSAKARKAAAAAEFAAKKAKALKALSAVAGE